MYKNSIEYTKKYSWNHESYASKSYPWTKDKLVKEPSVEIFILHWNSHIIWSLQQNDIMPVYNNKNRVRHIIDFVPTAVKHSWDFFFLVSLFFTLISTDSKLTSCVAKWEGVENYLKGIGK